MKSIQILVYCFILFFPIFSHAADTIPVVGIDEDGTTIEENMPTQAYTEQFQSILSTVNDSAIPVLTRHDNQLGWSLRTIVVGIGIGMELGIGPLIKVKATPRFRLAFSNSTDAVLP